MVRNVLWSWLGVAVNLFAGFILSPYIIRKLGLEGYGIWALVFSITGYYGLLDLGFRSAVVRYTAYYRARGEAQQINILLNTLLAYFSSVGLFLVFLSVLLAPRAASWFEVSPHYGRQFPALVLLVGISISIGVVFNVFTGAVEGFQRFDIANGIWLITFGIRYPGSAVLLALGYGLIEMAVLSLATQILLCALYALACKRLFPPLHLHWRFMQWPMFKQTFNFGAHTFVAGLSSQSLDQTPSLLIGHLQTVEQLGFYNLPVRLLQYAAEGVSRVGLILAPKAAELAAQGQTRTIARLAMFANRYCLIFYMPLSLFLLHWGRELFVVWLKERGPEVAANSGPLLPVLLVGTTLAMAGQFSSSTVLFGLSKHRYYALGLAVEAILSVCLMIVVLPRFGIFGASVVASCLMLLVRGLYTPWLVSRYLEVSWVSYMVGIYGRALAIAAPVYVLGWWLHRLIPGRDWGELIVAGGTLAAAYLSLALLFCLDPEHRDRLLDVARRRFAGGLKMA